MTTREVVLQDDDLVARARLAADRAARHLFAIQRADGHLVAELESNATLTAEYVFLRQMLGLPLADRAGRVTRWLFEHQQSDGGWTLAAGLPSDVSTTAEAFLALRLCGVAEDDPRLSHAASRIRSLGGLAKVRVFTRIHLACFGLWPWSAVPVLPPELILLPGRAPVSIYSFASWARATLIPLFVIAHHRPTFALPNGRSAENPWLDALWQGPRAKPARLRASALGVLARRGPGTRFLFALFEPLLAAYDRRPPRTLRARAVRACTRWILAHQDAGGDWGGIFPPMMNSLLALHLEGHALSSGPMQRGLAAIERFALDDGDGLRMQACVSPVWDTALSAAALLDAGVPADEPRVAQACEWLEARQVLDVRGDWSVLRPALAAGGWAFEYENRFYPDVDDTAAVLALLVRRCPGALGSHAVQRGLAWMLGMQSRDGGWGAFDADNDKTFLNDIPFSDMDSLCDPSTPDVTGHALELLGALRTARGADEREPAITRGLAYLRRTQEPEGAWYGRWGVHYLYGTHAALCAFASLGVPRADPQVTRALDWLRRVQNADGGFGESVLAYRDRAHMGRGTSTPSQTAWALLALLAYLPADHAAITRGVRWLLARQCVGAGPETGTWREPEFTATGFPNHFYLRYHLYRHYFPLMALGRWLRVTSATR